MGVSEAIRCIDIAHRDCFGMCQLSFQAMLTCPAPHSIIFRPGFPSPGATLAVDCASCHVGGRFKATPRQCFGCHNGAVTTGKSQSHQQTTAICEGCHQTTQWNDIRLIDHTQTTAPCGNCHNGTIAIGKSANHIATVAPCDTCHTSTVSFAIAAKMDHTGITDRLRHLPQRRCGSRQAQATTFRRT